MVAIISGTNRKNSYSLKISNYYQKLLNEKNIENEIIDLCDVPKDFLTSGLYETNGENERFNVLGKKIREADKYIFIIAEYNGSFPGILKLFLDGLEYPNGIRGKYAALTGISSGIQGGLLAMSHFTDILNYLGCHVIPIKPKITGVEKNFVENKFVTKLHADLINDQIAQLLKI